MAVIASVTVIPNPLGIRNLTGTSGEVTRYLLKLGIRVQNQARINCPVDTGRLRASIGVSEHPAPGGVTAVRIGSDVEYAIYVEKGTSRMRAQPYLEPALRSVMQSTI